MKHTMTRITSLLLAVIMLFSVAVFPVAAAGSYSDVQKEDWFYDAVEYVTEKGFMNGVSDHEFSPYTEVTRAMFVTVLARLAGAETEGKTAPFADVPAGKWYTGAVAWAAENGIVNGVSATRFAPDRSISRQDMCTIIARYINAMGYEIKLGEGIAFTDMDSVSGYAKDAVEFCSKAGLIGGFEDGTFRPRGVTTRAQIAAVMMRLDLKLQGQEVDPVPMPAHVFYDGQTNGMKVSVEAEEGMLPAESRLTVDREAGEAAVAAIENETERQVVAAADISFTNDGNEIEPNGLVEVHLIVDGLENRKNLAVVHMKDDGTIEEINSLQMVSIEGSGEKALRFYADEFSVYAIVADEQSDVNTFSIHYKFFAYNTTGETWDEYKYVDGEGNQTSDQYVGSGVTPVNPGTPTGVYAPEGREFVGWWTKEGNDPDGAWSQEVKFDEPVGELTSFSEYNVYARFDTVILVTYYNEQGQVFVVNKRLVGETILMKDHDASGNKYSDQYLHDNEWVYYQPASATKAFLGWAWFQGKTTESDIAADHTLNDGDAPPADGKYLYPVIADVYWVTYKSGPVGSNATYYAAEYYLDGNWTRSSLTDRVPTRPGYDFAGWYVRNEATQGDDEHLDFSWTPTSADIQITNAAGNFVSGYQNNAYFSNGKLAQNLTLVARWNPSNNTPYAFVYWQQSPEPVIVDGVKTYPVYKYKESKPATGTSGAQTATPPVPTWDDIAGYHLHSADPADEYTVQSKTINGDGTTIVNVYYDRNDYTVKYNVPEYTESTSEDAIYGKVGDKYVELTYTSSSETVYYYNGEEYSDTRYSSCSLSNAYENRNNRNQYVSVLRNGSYQLCRVTSITRNGNWYTGYTYTVRYTYNGTTYTYDGDTVYYVNPNEGTPRFGFMPSNGMLQLTTGTVENRTWFYVTKPESYQVGTNTNYWLEHPTYGWIRVWLQNDGYWHFTYDGQSLYFTSDVSAYVYIRNEYTGERYEKDWVEAPELTITAKYGENVSSLWPSKVDQSQWPSMWSTEPDGHTYQSSIGTMLIGNYDFFYLDEDRTQAANFTQFYLQHLDGTFSSAYSSEDSTTLQDIFYGNTSFFTTKEDYAVFEGFKLNIDPTGTITANDHTYRNTDIDAIYRTWDSSLPDSSWVGSSYDSANNRTVKFYYVRQTYTITFMLENTVIATVPYLYEQPLDGTKAKVGDSKDDADNGEYSQAVWNSLPEGMRFRGWYDNAAGLGYQFDFNTEMPANNIVLYARVTPYEYYVRLDYNGGETKGDESTFAWLEYGELIQASDDVRREYVQVGDDVAGDRFEYRKWVYDEEADAAGDFWGSYYVDINGNRVYAYDENNGHIYSGTYQGDGVRTAKYKANTNGKYIYNPAAYSFIGWYETDKDGNQISNVPFNLTTAIRKETYIKAMFRKEGVFKVRYVSDMNEGEEDEIKGDAENLPEDTYTYMDLAEARVMHSIAPQDAAHYVFKGWRVRGTQSPIYQAGGTFYINSDYVETEEVNGIDTNFITLEPVFEKHNTTAVSYDLNGGSLAEGAEFDYGMPGNSDGTLHTTQVDGAYIIYGLALNAKLKLSEPEITRDGGYIFAGWSTVKFDLDEVATKEEAKAAGATIFAPGYSYGISENTNEADAVEIQLTRDGTTTTIIPNKLYALWLKDTHFYVVHSSNGKVEAYNLKSGFDLASHVNSGYLYGGYYSAYGGVEEKLVTDSIKNYQTGKSLEWAITSSTAAGEKAADHTISSFTKYDGKTKLWSADKAITDVKGTAVNPESGTIYYLKEVPQSYLTTKFVYVYDTWQNGLLINFYMLTVVDDNLYTSTGVNYNSGKDAAAAVNGTFSKGRLCTSFTVVQKGVETEDGEVDIPITVDATSFGMADASHGYISVKRVDEFINTCAGSTYTLLPTWKTLDGVDVYSRGPLAVGINSEKTQVTYEDIGSVSTSRKIYFNTAQFNYTDNNGVVQYWWDDGTPYTWVCFFGTSAESGETWVKAEKAAPNEAGKEHVFVVNAPADSWSHLAIYRKNVDAAGYSSNVDNQSGDIGSSTKNYISNFGEGSGYYTNYAWSDYQPYTPPATTP